MAHAQTHSLAWDESSTGVTGYAVTVDGVRTDYKLTPVASSGACSCSIPLPFTGGQHTVVVSAYNAAGETAAPALVVGPKANAGGPYSGTLGTSIAVSGAASVDASAGTLKTYAWQWGDGTTATSSSSATATHVYAAAGSFTLTLTVTDNAGATASATTSVTVSGAPATIPSPWQQSDIGSVGKAGGASYSSGTFTATGAGADIWGTADAFHYVYESLSGDGQIIARVVGLANTNANAKAGVMFRESLSAGASHVMLDLEPTGTVEFMQRSATGAAATQVATATDAQPIWLKLVRSASSFSASTSPDGVTWTSIGTTTVSMAAAIDVGFVVCSHDTTTLNTATFDHVSVTANAPTPPSTPASPSPTDGAAGVSTSATLTWAAAGATSYDVKLGTSNPPPTVSTSQSAATLAASSLLAGTKYFWQIVAHNASGATSGAVWSFTTATAGAPGGLPSPWQSHDVGNVGAVGSASFSSGTFTVKGGGADIWGTVDAFQYAELPLSGDVQFIARVTSLTNTNTYAKAGIMMRASLDPSAPQVILDVRPNGGVEFMTRSAQNGSTTDVANATQTAPTWLKLVRSGSTATGYVSRDGATWSQVGSTTTSVGASPMIGLAVTSHDATVAATATFDSASMTSGTPPVQPPASSGDVVLYGSDATTTMIHGAWKTASSSTSPNSIMLTTPNNGVSNANAALAAPTDYVDLTFTAAAGTPYRIWLRLRAQSDNKFNDSLWVQFSDAQVGGNAAYRINTTSGLLVNLATDGSGNSIAGWGWQNSAYWLSQGTTITFPTSGMHTIRLQTREDGLSVDQIVLSPGTYLNAAPGGVAGDGTIVSR